MSRGSAEHQKPTNMKKNTEHVCGHGRAVTIQPRFILDAPLS